MTIEEANKPLVIGLKVIIAQKGLKQIYIAEQAGYTAQEFNDMLNGRKLIKACDIPKIAKALGVTADTIYMSGKEFKAGE